MKTKIVILSIALRMKELRKLIYFFSSFMRQHSFSSCLQYISNIYSVHSTSLKPPFCQYKLFLNHFIMQFSFSSMQHMEIKISISLSLKEIIIKMQRLVYVIIHKRKRQVNQICRIAFFLSFWCSSWRNKTQ